MVLPAPSVKPDPPSNVMVRQIEGHETWLKVVWSLPTSWKSADNFYELIHEIKYRPDKSPFHQEQVRAGRQTAGYPMFLTLSPCVSAFLQFRSSVHRRLLCP